MAFSFKDLFKNEEQSGKSTQPLVMEPSGSVSRAGLSFGSGDKEGEMDADRENHSDSFSETTPEMTTDMAVNPFEQNLAQGHPAPPQSNHGPAQSPFGMGAGATSPQGNPAAQAPASPFSQAPSPFQQAAPGQQPQQGQPNGNNGQNGQNGEVHRVQDLENKGFRPLSSLPGGQVPSPGPGLTGSLPPQASPFNANGNGQGISGSPFEIPPKETPAAPGFASPFEVQAAPPSNRQEEPPPNPFSAAPQQPAQPASPFGLANPSSQESSSANAPASPFGLPSGSTPPPQAPAPAPAQSFEPPAPAPQPQVQPERQAQEAPKAAEEPKRVELNLKEVLINVPQDLLGFDALKIPDEVTATFSMKSIKPQLSTGRVVLPLQEVIDGCQEKFHPAFAKADRETLVSLPMESLFHQLPVDEPVAPPTPAAPATPAPANPFTFEAPAPTPPKAELPPAGNPFEMTAPPAQAQEAPAPTPAPAASPAESSPFGAALPPFGSAAAWPAQQETPAAPPLSFHDQLPPLGQSPAPAVSAPAPAPAKESHDAFLPDSDDAQDYNPFSFDPSAGANSPLDAPLSGTEKPTSAPFNPFGMGDAAPAAPKATPAFDPPAQAPAPAAKSPAPAQNADQDEQLHLRALFMTGGNLDAKRVVELCEEMPGIKACCLLSENGQIQASTINSQEFSRNAQSMVTGLVSLSSGLGVENSRAFTMRTDSGAITFFKAQPIYLGVQHSDADFQPGVREKLTLISRELARMC